MSEPSGKLAIGTTQFGMSYGIANKNGQVHRNDITAILDLGWGNGINTLDTAKAYGTSEESIGNYLKGHLENSWEIITKISDRKNSLSDQLNDSIEKLTIRPTSVLAHSAELFLDNTFQTKLQEAKEEQSISNTGVSLYSENEINQILESDFNLDIIQLPLNILDTRLYHHGILRQLAEKGIEIHARSAFLQGLFYLSKIDLEDRFEDVIPSLEKLKSISAAAGLTLPELSLLWLVNLKEVTKVIIGIDNVEQLRMHLQTLKKNVDTSVFEEALSINYENENILNPSLWPAKS
ncbi:MAG: aldo/keto reductase [Bacteroidales bacterium]|nr:aldo/keto reductase [Bacteroidales bacterium]